MDGGKQAPSVKILRTPAIYSAYLIIESESEDEFNLLQRPYADYI